MFLTGAATGSAFVAYPDGPVAHFLFRREPLGGVDTTRAEPGSSGRDARYRVLGRHDGRGAVGAFIPPSIHPDLHGARGLLRIYGLHHTTKTNKTTTRKNQTGQRSHPAVAAGVVVDRVEY